MKGPVTSFALLLMLYALLFELQRFGGESGNLSGTAPRGPPGSIGVMRPRGIPLPQAIRAALTSAIAVLWYEIIPECVRECGRFSAEAKA